MVYYFYLEVQMPLLVVGMTTSTVFTEVQALWFYFVAAGGVSMPLLVVGKTTSNVYTD